MHSTGSLLLSSLAFSSGALAWGDLGHQVVALIAQNYVSSQTASFVQNILGSTSDTYMADVATWADSYKFTSEGAFSYDYHFIDAEDNPPSSCSVDYERDCGSNGCSVSAIGNYVGYSLPRSSSLASRLTIAVIDFQSPRHFAAG